MIIRLSILFFFALILHPSASCQNDTVKIPVSAYWSTGDVYKFNITKVKKTWNGKVLARKDSVRYLATFKVLSFMADTFKIQWSFKNPLLQTFNLPENSKAKLSKYENIDVIYKTNEFGVLWGVDNWKDISAMINELIREVISLKIKSGPGTDSAEIKKALDPVISVYNTRRGIEQLLVKELLMFHFPYGKEYTLGQIYNYTEKLPVMMNAPPATGTGIIFVRNVNEPARRCEIVQRLKILPDTAQRFIRRYFIDLGMKPEAIGSSVAVSRLEINDNNIFDISYYPGVPLKITVSRETIIDILDDKIKQTDLTIIEKTDN